MGPDLTQTRQTSACPSCGASVKPKATFCGQCYADFRPAPAPTPVPLPPSAPLTAPAQRSAYGPPAPDPLTAPLADVTTAAVPGAPTDKPKGWPCTRCQTLNPFEAQVCSLCGGGFLATETGGVSLVLPVVGDLTRYGRGQRVGIAFAVLAIVLVPLALVTLLLTSSPPAGSKGGSTSTGTTTGSTGSSGSQVPVGGTPLDNTAVPN